MNEEQNIIEPQQPAFLQGAVMRSASEIEMRLEELQLDFDECKKWYDNVYKKYEDDRKYWGKGEADPNEYLEASRQLELIKLQLKTLKWVLGGHLI